MPKIIPKQLIDIPTFIPTKNKMGFMCNTLDDISLQFLKDIEQHNMSKVLEVGSAYGHLALKVLSKKVKLTCVDLSEIHLQILKDNCPKELLSYLKTFSCDIEHLPCDNLYNFDAAMLCRVIHFFSGEKIMNVLKKIFNLLAFGGKIYIVADSPFKKHWEKFLPTYHERVKKGNIWPGEAEEKHVNIYEKDRLKFLPKFLHWIDKPSLKRALTKTGFKIKKIGYSSRPDLPPFALLNGKESIYAIAEKPKLNLNK